MALHNEKLSKVFEKYAGKIVNYNEMNSISLKELHKKLSGKEMRDYFKACKNVREITASDVNDALQKKLIEAVGDGTIGQYENEKGEVFLNVNQMNFIIQNSKEFEPFIIKYPPKIVDKVAEATAKAIKSAKDYRKDAKTDKLTLTPIPF